MTKTQVYLPEEQLAALHEVAKRERKSVAAVIRDAIGEALGKRSISKQRGRGPVALWAGKPKRTALDHDSIYDQP